jgi:hypothetical protein
MKLLDVVAEVEGMYPRNLSVREMVTMDGDWLAAEFVSHPDRWRISVRITDGDVIRERCPIGEWREVHT